MKYLYGIYIFHALLIAGNKTHEIPRLYDFENQNQSLTNLQEFSLQILPLHVEYVKDKFLF